MRCDFWRLAAQSNHCQFSLQYSRVLLLSVNYFHAKVWPSNTSCFPIKVTFIFNRESTYYILVLVNRWCVCTNSCLTLISGIKYVMEDSPAEDNSKTYMRANRVNTEALWKCLFASTRDSALRVQAAQPLLLMVALVVVEAQRWKGCFMCTGCSPTMTSIQPRLDTAL